MAFQFIPAADEAALPQLAALSSTLGCFSDTGASSLRGGVLLLGGPVQAARCAQVAGNCRRRGIGTVILGFDEAPAQELRRFCEGLRSRGLRPVVAERVWRSGCGAAAVLLSTAISGGSLRQRLQEAKSRYGELLLDLERLCHSFPLPCPDGCGEPISQADLAAFGGKPFFSEDLQCRVKTLQRGRETRFALYDDPASIRRKAALADSLGIRQGLLLYPEWSLRELREIMEKPDHHA